VATPIDTLGLEGVRGEDRMAILLSLGASHGCVACTGYAHGACVWGLSV